MCILVQERRGRRKGKKGTNQVADAKSADLKTPTDVVVADLLKEGKRCDKEDKVTDCSQNYCEIVNTDDVGVPSCRHYVPVNKTHSRKSYFYKGVEFCRV